MLSEDTVPHLAAGVKFRLDAVRNAWVLLAPERLFQLDEIAVEVMKLVDGQRSVAMIADSLASKFAAPREEISGDVSALLQDLAARGALRL